MKKLSGSVLIVSETYLPLFGGAEMYTYNFAHQLERSGSSVSIATYSAGDMPSAYKGGRVEVVALKKIRKSQVFKFPLLFMQLYRLVKAHEAVYANYTYALSTLTVVAGLLQGKRVTVFAHGLGTIIDGTHPFIFRVYRFVTLKLAHAVVATSQEIADIVARFNRRVLVATAVDFSRVDAALAASPAPTAGARKTILTIRRLVEKNGIQYLIESIPHLLRKRADFACDIVGDGRLKAELQARAEELGISDHVRFLGAYENDRVFAAVRDADCVVFPSSAEALSLAAIECMYLKTPILVSGVGGLLDLAGKNEERGSVVDLFGRSESVYAGPPARSISPEIYGRFAEKLDAILARSPEIDKRADAARAYVASRYDWQQVAEVIRAFAET